MNITLDRLDQIRTASPESLPALCAALVSLFEGVAVPANAWSAVDHNDDGTHQVVRIGGTEDAPSHTVGRMTLFLDGSDLKVVRPDGTIGTVTIT